MVHFLQYFRSCNLTWRIGRLSFFLLVFPGTLVTHIQDSNVEGHWFTPKKDCMVHLYLKQSTLYGQFEWFADSQDTKGILVKDAHNPDKKLRDRLLQGKVFISGFTYNSKKQIWTGGRLYNPENGKTYRANIRMKGRDTLEIRGFIGVSLIGKTSVWTRKL